MKKLLLAGACATALALGVSTAKAQDWAGPYIGGHVGYIDINSTITPIPGGVPVKLSPDSFIGGVLGGYNVHVNSDLVLGIEADFGLFDANDTVGGIVNSFDWNAHVRGRLGYSMGQFMVFAAAGLALSEIKTNIGIPPFKKNLTGFTVGGGIDFKVLENLSVRGEYLYDNYGKKSTPPINRIRRQIDVDSHTFRLSLSWHFGDSM